jgi:hypothetical protein
VIWLYVDTGLVDTIRFRSSCSGQVVHSIGELNARGVLEFDVVRDSERARRSRFSAKKSLPMPAFRGMNATARTSKLPTSLRRWPEAPGRSLKARDAGRDIERQRE